MIKKSRNSLSGEVGEKKPREIEMTDEEYLMVEEIADALGMSVEDYLLLAATSDDLRPVFKKRMVTLIAEAQFELINLCKNFGSQRNLEVDKALEQAECNLVQFNTRLQQKENSSVNDSSAPCNPGQ